MDELLQDLTVTANDYAGRDGFDEASWARLCRCPASAE